MYEPHIDYTKKLFRRVNRKSVTGNTEQSQAAYSYHSLVDMNEQNCSFDESETLYSLKDIKKLLKNNKEEISIIFRALTPA